jgi:hypothetical protein
MRSPAEMGEEVSRQFLLHLLDEKQISRSTYRRFARR